MQEKLQNLGEIILGHTFRAAMRHDSNGELCILQAKNVNDDGSLDSNYIRTSAEITRARGIVKNSDIILTNRGLFRASVYKGDDKNLIAAASVYLLRMNKKIVNPEFLAVFLNSRTGQALLKQCIRGATIPSLPKSCLKTLQIPIPSQAMQELIININNNNLRRSRLYEKRARLHKEISEAAISKLLAPHT
jgi:restriction endonuclease S subunit